MMYDYVDLPCPRCSCHFIAWACEEKYAIDNGQKELDILVELPPKCFLWNMFIWSQMLVILKQLPSYIKIVLNSSFISDLFSSVIDLD